MPYKNFTRVLDDVMSSSYVCGCKHNGETYQCPHGTYFIPRQDRTHNTKPSYMTNLTRKLKNLALDATTRTLRAHGLEDENGNMTNEARESTIEEMVEERWASRREMVANVLAAEDKK